MCSRDLLAILALLALLLERLLHAQYQKGGPIDGQALRRCFLRAATSPSAAAAAAATRCSTAAASAAAAAATGTAAAARLRLRDGRMVGGRRRSRSGRIAVHAAVVAGVRTPNASAQRMHCNAVEANTLRETQNKTTTLLTTTRYFSRDTTTWTHR